MGIKLIYILIPSVIILSCKNSNKSITLNDTDSIINSFKKAKESGVQIEGQFVRIETLNEKESNLYLKLNSDSIVAFRTIMPIDSNEISRLKKGQNNIKLTYTEFNNPITKKVDKVVQFMQPIYEQVNK
ncbi:MAG: hypothetical protein ABIP30_07620 [Ferruginibacter sp.]